MNLTSKINRNDGKKGRIEEMSSNIMMLLTARN